MISFDDADVSTFKRSKLRAYYRNVQGVFQDPFSSYNPIFKADRVFSMIREEYFPQVSGPDVSIMAWDDSVLCEIVHPPLTALSRDIMAYGAHAAERLLELLEGETVTDFQDDMPRLTIRGSTARPRG